MFEGPHIPNDELEKDKVESSASDALEAPLEDWKNRAYFRINLGVHRERIDRIVEPLKETHPEWFRSFKNKTGMGEYFSPELVSIVREELEKYKKAPEGWEVISTLEELTGKSGGFISKTIEPYRETHPEWFKDYLSKRSKILEHYAPELITILKKEFQSYEYAPEGWKTRNSVAKSLNATDFIVQKIVNQFEQIHPELVKDYMTKSGVLTHFSPELILIIEEELLKEEKAPEGWEVISMLAELTDRSPLLIRRTIEPYRETHPEWFKNYKTRSGLFEHFSPELVAVIKNEFLKEEKPPEGWMNRNELHDSLGISYKKLNRMVATQKEIHPEWFKFFKGKALVTEYVSPDAILFFKDIVVKEEEPQKGWMSPGELGDYLKVAFKTIKKVAVEHKKSNPEWYKLYKSDNANMTEYYSPELVMILEDRFLKPPPPLDWKTIKSFAVSRNSAVKTIEKLVESYRETNPEWFKNYRTNNGVHEHISPELISVIENYFSKQSPLKGWEVLQSLIVSTGRSNKFIEKLILPYRETHPEWFKEFRSEDGNLRKYYSPELISIIKNELSNTEFVPEGWVTRNFFSKSKGVDVDMIEDIIAPYKEKNPEWFRKFVSKNGGQKVEYLSPELVSILQKELVDNIAPEGWKVLRALRFSIGISGSPIKKIAEPYRDSNPEWFKTFRSEDGNLREYFSPELVSIIETELLKEGEAPEGWLRNTTIANSLEVTKEKTKKLADQSREAHPEWFKDFRGKEGIFEYYSPELILIIKNSIFIEENEAPGGWETNKGLQNKTNFSYYLLEKIEEPYRLTHPEWFKNFRSKTGVYEHLSPELVSIIKEEAERRQSYESEILNRENFDKNLVGFLKGVDSSKEGIEFKDLISVFGSSSVLDILYATHPEFKAVPVERVKSVIAEYLGNYLLSPGAFSLDSVKNNLSYLKEENIKNGLVEVVKDHCLTYFLEYKKANHDKDDQQIFTEYFAQLEDQTSSFNNADLDSVIKEITEYYQSIFNLEKGEHLIESLNSGRSFPDIYQSINIKEISDKKRLLIADEMGVGKSASAIIAKESLGSKLALVVVPSNVVNTWEKYLSDTVGEDAKKIGYFKSGEAPRVLVVNDIEELNNIDQNLYDYILISHEKLTGKYTGALDVLDYDMLIVDEVHKFKNLSSAKRPEQLIRLAEKIQGDDKYLALLSGTPVPNKIEDVALLLRLLHPDRFEDQDNKQIVSSVLNGNLSDIRALLVPYMQRKDLRDHIEMPKLDEEVIPVTLTGSEKDVYEVLLEEDELTPTEKMITLRRFLMNHETLDITPNIQSSKVETLKGKLTETFESKDKVVLFVNDYVKGVIEGDNSILSNLELPEDVEIKVVYGEVSQAERVSIQEEFNTENGKKILLVVSGQTAGVGVDYTGGEHIYFYNEPWTKADSDQQKARVYRPGLKHDIQSETLITKDTIEEGIHRYVELKHQAVNKLLNGIPITEFEKELLEKSEQSEGNLEVNPELANYYFSSFDKMNRIFAAVKEMGEENFWDFIEKHGAEYADCYFELGNRSYQANASRVCATLIDSMIKAEKSDPKDLKIIDIASGPEMLRRHSKEDVQSAIVSADININHFINRGTKDAVVAGFTELPFPDNNFDYANFSLAFHYSKFLPSKNEYERAEVLKEINRVLKVDGTAVINMIYSLDFKDVDKFKKLVGSFGFDVVEGYSGEVESSDNYRSRVITLRKNSDIEQSAEEVLKDMTREEMDGLKFVRTTEGLKDSRKIVSDFKLNGKSFHIDFNDSDKIVVREEKGILEDGKRLKDKYGSIKDISKEEVVNNNFVRLLVGEKHILFKKLSKGGVVLVR